MMAAGLWQGERRDNNCDFPLCFFFLVFSILNQSLLFREIDIGFSFLLFSYIYIYSFVFIYICFYPLLSYILFSVTWGEGYNFKVILFPLFFLIFYFTHQSFRFISFLLFLLLLLLFLILILYFLLSKNLSLKNKIHEGITYYETVIN